MARANDSIHPLQNLRDAATSLEASISSCLDKPDKTAVHRLRTTTRRIEALLELLSMLSAFPPPDVHQRKAHRLLKKLRRAAGEIRDIDVQRDLIRDETAASKRTHGPDPSLHKEGRRLRRKLKRKRDDEADDLLRLLRKQQIAFPRVFEKLLEAFTLPEPITLSEATLINLVREWYRQRAANHTSDSIAQDAAHFHQIRKRAKLARYLAESAPRSAVAARRLGAQFEHLQQAGGKWHDLLLLAEVSSNELGSTAKLPQLFSMKANRALKDFQGRLRYKI